MPAATDSGETAMMVYVLEGHMSYEGFITLGVYASSAEAAAAARVFEQSNRLRGFPTDYIYRVNAVELGAAANEYVYAELVNLSQCDALVESAS